MRIIKMAGREAHASADDIDDFLHVFLRRLIMNPAGQGWLIHLNEADGIHDEISQIVAGISASPFLTTYGAVYERLITGKIFCRCFAGKPHDFRAFDDEAA